MRESGSDVWSTTQGGVRLNKGRAEGPNPEVKGGWTTHLRHQVGEGNLFARKSALKKMDAEGRGSDPPPTMGGIGGWQVGPPQNRGGQPPPTTRMVSGIPVQP